jgi:hypothetical protein
MVLQRLPSAINTLVLGWPCNPTVPEGSSGITNMIKLAVHIILPQEMVKDAEHF